MIPVFEEFLYPFLLILKDGQITTKAMEQKLIKHFSLTQADCDLRTSGGSKTQISDRIGWCRQYFRRALFISIPRRGTYEITQRGLDYLANNTSLKIADLLKYKEFAEYANRGEGSEKDASSSTTSILIAKTPTQELEDAFKTIKNTLEEELLDKLTQIDWKFFEKLVVDLLVKMGYGGTFKESATVTRPSKDGGIDGIIKEDKLGFDTIYVQAKKWNRTKKVSEPNLKEFAGTLDGLGASKGVYITTCNFAETAIQYAKNSPKKIILIDGQQLAKYMIEYNVGVTEEKSYVVKRIDSDYFDEE